MRIISNIFLIIVLFFRIFNIMTNFTCFRIRKGNDESESETETKSESERKTSVHYCYCF